MKNIVILTNTFPYGGEQFLKTEIAYFPLDWRLTLFPLFPKNGVLPNKQSMQGTLITPSKNYSYGQRSRAFLRSLKMLISSGEIIEVKKHKKLLRNFFKALKFGYVSELRIMDYDSLQNLPEGEIIFYSYWMYEAAYVAAKLKDKFPGSKFVTRCHGYDLYENRHVNGYLPYRKYIMSHSDFIYPVSQQGKNYLHKLYNGIYDSKISVSRLGTTKLLNVKVDGSCQRDRILIVSCSNLIPLKRIDRIIGALKQVDYKLEWIHFGTGPLEEELKSMAANLPSNIEANFMGQVPNEAIQEYYSDHHVTAFINVSNSEGVPVSIMEAQSYGIPVIATNVGGTSEIVINNINGILLDENFESFDLVSAIGEVKMNWNVYSRNAIRTWESLSNAAITTSEFFGELNKILCDKA